MLLLLRCLAGFWICLWILIKSIETERDMIWKQIFEQWIKNPSCWNPLENTEWQCQHTVDTKFDIIFISESKISKKKSLTNNTDIPGYNID